MEYAEQSHLHLRYALQRGTESHLRFVDDVPKGLKCNCVCPYCKVDLMAKQGQKKEHHFAHKNNKNCTGARMTALHMLAQQILARDKKLMLPDYIGLYYQKATELIEFDEVKIEKSTILDNKLYRPDCIGIKYGNNIEHRLWIEIFVTHEVDSDKFDSICKSNQPCIEIDLSEMLKTDYTEESVAKRLQEQKDDRMWICCPICENRNEENRIKTKQAEYEKWKKEEAEDRKRTEEYNKKIEEQKKSKLHCQTEQNRPKNNAVSPTNQVEQLGPDFDSRSFTPGKKDRIIQAVRGGSVNPASEIYSEELAKEFHYPYQNSNITT